MTPDDLDTKSLEELDAIFAVEVAGWWPHATESKKCHDPDGLSCYWDDVPNFSTSAEAVLPWLEKWQVVENAPHRSITIMRTNNCERQWMVELEETTDNANELALSVTSFAPTFPHAAVKALIRAERARKQPNA